MASHALSVRNLSKTFGGAKALDGVDLDIGVGEIHGLLGQNGSGKSTFVKVLAGFHEPDAGGTLLLNGKSIRLPLSAGEFRDLGFSFVHQNLGLVPDLSVLENLRVGEITTSRKPYINWSRERQRAAETFERFDINIDPDAIIADLSQVDRALVAIIRAFEEISHSQALHHTNGLLLLDEPTPFLPKAGVEKLFGLVRGIVESGASVIFISHDIDEILEITDRVTVLRDGRVAGQLETADSTKQDIVEMIVGRQLEHFETRRIDTTDRKVLGKVRALSGETVAPMDLDIHEGEVIGVTGLIGSGYAELAYLLFGAKAADTGTLEIDGVHFNLDQLTPRLATDCGIALLPADRQGASGVGSLSVKDNMLLPDLDNFFSNFLLQRGQMTKKAIELGEKFEVRPNDPEMPLSALSGGNAQKVLLAKWINRDPRLLILDEPTQGVDVGTRQQVYQSIKDVAETGAAVVCASSDYEQLADICDRVLVFGRGEIIAELVGDNISKTAIAQQCYASTTVDSIIQK